MDKKQHKMIVVFTKHNLKNDIQIQKLVDVCNKKILVNKYICTINMKYRFGIRKD